MLKLPAFVRRTSRRTSARPVEDSLEAFGSEQTPARTDPTETVGRRTVATGVLAFSLLPALVFGTYALDWVQSASERASLSASLTIESDPVGAEVHVDGVRKGTTPLTLRVAPGPQAVDVVLGEHRQAFSAVAREGANIVHRVAFVAAPAPPAVPVKTSGSAAGRGPQSANRPAGPVAGWLSVKSPVTLQVIQGSQVIGTTDVPRMMLAAGRHELRFANAGLGFSDRRVVNVQPGRSASITIDVPTARLNLSDLPGADAWSEGEPVGTAAIGRIGMPIGTNDLVVPIGKVPGLPPVKASYVGPVAVQEELPPWTPPSGAARWAEYVGVFRVRIGVDGRVTGSEVLEASHPAYDAQLARAASDWLYRPAIRNGRPVPSVKDIQIRLVPR